METRDSRIYMLIKKLRTAEELYKCACLGGFKQNPPVSFLRMLAMRKHFYQEEIANHLNLKIEKDYLALDDEITETVDTELKKLHSSISEHDMDFLLQYFIDAEKSLVNDYSKIIKNDNYNYLTRLILFESQVTDIEGHVDEMREMQEKYTAAEAI